MHPFIDFSRHQVFCYSFLKQNEFNGNDLSNAVGDLFHIFIIVLLAECEKNHRPRLTEHAVSG
jgi:hypothetical protein